MKRPRQGRTPAPVTIAVLAGGTLLAAMWIANQRGFAPVAPAKYLASLRIILTCVPVLAAWWVGAAGLGYVVRRYLAPHIGCGVVVQLGAGLGALLMIDFLLAWAGWLNRATAWLPVAAGGAALVWQWLSRKTEKDEHDHWHLPWPVIVAMPPLGVLLVACTCPPWTLWDIEAYGYDVLSYHLQLPREWLELGGWQGLEHNVYSFLPSLAEIGYMQVGAMFGSMQGQAIYAAQLLHASTAVLAAAAVGCLVARNAGNVIGALAAAIFLAVPWTTIVASCAYNEMFALALGGTAMLVVFDIAKRGSHWRSALLTGFLLGCATLAKPPAGLMIAGPIVLIMLFRLNLVTGDAPIQPWRRAVGRGLVVVAAVAVTLTPYFARNALATGNPVFPFATGVFGKAHWGDFEVRRWRQGHRSDMPLSGRIRALGEHWLANEGYGAIGGADRLRQPPPSAVQQRAARFKNQWGWPVLWPAALAGAVLMLTASRGRRRATGMLLILVFQLGFWLAATHLQSRFLVPTLLPACLLIGGGVGRLKQFVPRVRWAPAVIAVGVVASLTLTSYAVFFTQTRAGRNHDGSVFHFPPWQIVDSLAPAPQIINQKLGPRRINDHPISHLPADSLTYLVADNARLLYLRRPFVYESGFDSSLMGRLIRRHGHDPLTAPADVTKALRRRGITHVWIHRGELARLHAGYGHDANVTVRFIDRMVAEAGWRVVWDYPDTPRLATLYQLP